MQKTILFSQHASEQMQFRGASNQEVIQAIRTGPWKSAQSGRIECHKNFVFNAVWNGRLYATKQVRPIFISKAKVIVVVTVYVYYF